MVLRYGRDIVKLEHFLRILDTLQAHQDTSAPAYKLRRAYKRNPYTILMTTLLSLRTKDEHTAKVAARLFNTVQTPQELLEIPLEELEQIVKPTGMYRQKARTLREVSKLLIERHNATVPDNKEALLCIKGIGEKTANIVLNNAFDKGVIAVDTHVHRLCNMWGVIDTKTEKESSRVLNAIVPEAYRGELNFLLVSFGQSICTPKNPKCAICSVEHLCTARSYAHPFAPFIDAQSEILILGTFPSIKSFEQNFYYAHPQNQFWRLLSGVFDEDTPQSIEEKKIFLTKHRIALWDVIGSCKRTNSLDSNLKDIELNDIEALLRKYPNIKKIYFTSKTGEKLFKKARLHVTLPTAYLASPSPAYAALPFARKLQKWRDVLPCCD